MSSPAVDPPRLNILHLVSDQHQAGCVGYEGHPQAITPRLDAFACQATRFRHAYTANPICTPTRVSMLSGQYCHNHGYYGLNGPTPSNLSSYLGHFRANGYRTAAVGKLHLPDDPHDWARDHCDQYANIMNRTSDARPLYAELAEAGFPDEFDNGFLTDLPGTGNNAVDARPSKLPFRLSAEGYTNRLAMEFMRRSADTGEPFCMQVSYHRPHQVYTAARAFWDLYDDDLELPPGALEDLNPDRPPHFLAYAHGHRDMPGHYHPEDPLARMKRVWKGYLACVTHIDHAVGELLDALERLGIADRTVVVYHADHGAYSGTFGINEKAPGICSEQVCRVPMIWRCPGRVAPGRELTALAHLVDLAPTFCSLAGVDPMPTADGIDLGPALAGATDQTGRTEAVTECPWARSIRFDRWRYVHYPRGFFAGFSDTPGAADFPGELYDIDADPLETRNLIASDEHQPVVHEARRRLLDWLSTSTHAVTALPAVANNRAPVTPSALSPHLQAGRVHYL